jgi:hypothetical protein
MSIFILPPDPAHCRPFFIAQQLEAAAWGHGPTEAEARSRMAEHRKFNPALEAKATQVEGQANQSTNP